MPHLSIYRGEIINKNLYPMKNDNPNAVRLQKHLAHAGVASRREIETWIEEGRVTINGHRAKLGQKIDPERDVIKVNKKVIRIPKPATLTLIMNKPKGVICSNRDPNEHNTVFSILPKQYRKIRLFCAGRLDKDSEGMVILTNDGDLKYRLTHPSFLIKKRYQVNIDKPFDPSLGSKMIRGIRVDDEKLKVEKIVPLGRNTEGSRKLEIHMHHGKKREIRRLLGNFGYQVNKLVRFQIGKLTLKNIPKGCVRELKKDQIDALFR